MKPTTRWSLAAALLLTELLLTPPLLGADEWPQYDRVRTSNAVSPEKSAPLSWQLEERGKGSLTQPAWNIEWQADLGFSSFASPVVSGDLVWVGTNNSKPRDPKFKDDAAVLMCFRARDGKF